MLWFDCGGVFPSFCGSIDYCDGLATVIVFLYLLLI